MKTIVSKAPRYNFHCFVCNELVEVQDFGFGVTSARSESPPTELVVCAVHGDCLRTISAPGYNLRAGLLPPEWRCLVCGETSDPQRGLAILTEFGRDGEQRVGSAPNHTAHAACVREAAHAGYEFRTVPQAT